MIELIRLVNVQSFKDETFRLSPEINVFDAPNETGKSVIFKVFRKMCDSNWYGRSNRQSLIRRGESHAVALIVLGLKNNETEEDRIKVIFEMFKTYQMYRLYKGNEEVSSWKQDTIPKDIADVLCWSYEPESKRLLNLCDQELDMPFVNNNNKSNYETMKFIIHDAELDAARSKLYEWNCEVESEISAMESTMNKYFGMISALDYVDTDKLSRSIDKRELIHSQSKLLFDLIENLTACAEQKKPEQVEDRSSDIEARINEAKALYDFGKNLQDVVVLRRPSFKTIDSGSVEDIIKVSKILNSLVFNLRSTSNCTNELKGAKMRVENEKEIIEDFETKNKICPLCGNEFSK